MRPSRGPWNQKIFSEFSTDVIVLYVFFAGEWKSVMKIKSCTDSSEAVLIYFTARHTTKTEESSCRTIVLQAACFSFAQSITLGNC